MDAATFYSRLFTVLFVGLWVGWLVLWSAACARYASRTRALIPFVL
jgi:hypothetical protein